jgi:hypothetical protein
MNHMLKIMAVSICLLLIGACSHTNWRALWAVKDIDYKTVDPSDFRLALVLPEAAEFESVTINIQFIRGDVVVIDDQIDLEIIVSGREINKVGFPSTQVNKLVLKVPPNRVSDIVRFQNLIAEESAAPTEGAQATFGVGAVLSPSSVKEFCVSGKRKMKISAWVLIDEKRGYLPLLTDSNLGKLIGERARDICVQN